jgi:hypothetical protein
MKTGNRRKESEEDQRKLNKQREKFQYQRTDSEHDRRQKKNGGQESE